MDTLVMVRCAGVLSCLSCVVLFGGCGNSRDVINDLKNPNPYIQAQAIKKILEARHASPEVIEPLSRCMESHDFTLGVKAAEALGSIGEGAVVVLKRKLRSPDAEIRFKAAFGLSRTGRAAYTAGDALIAALRDRDPSVRQYAALALGSAGVRAAIPALTAALEDEYAVVRNAAALSLRMLGAGAPSPSSPKSIIRKREKRL